MRTQPDPSTAWAGESTRSGGGWSRSAPRPSRGGWDASPGPRRCSGPRTSARSRRCWRRPLPLADQRASLWKAGIDLERRLAEATLGLESPSGSAVAFEAAGDPTGGDAAGPGTRRARVFDALLALSGSGAIDWAGLEAFLAGEGGNSRRRERAGRLVSPWAESPILDHLATDPTRVRRIEEFAKLRRWLAARYAFEGRDPARSDFFEEAARDYEPAEDRSRPTLEIEAEVPPAVLDAKHPEMVARLAIRPAALAAEARVEVATQDDGWLIARAGPSVPDADGWVKIPLMIELRPEPDASRLPVPPGLLARIDWHGRSYHRRIPLRIEPESRRPQLIFAASPSDTSPIASRVSLRAAQGKVSYSIFVRNPGDRDRRFDVSLAHRRGDLAGGSTSLTVKAGETARVTFGPPPPSIPDEGLVDFLGPLSIRLSDVDDAGFRVVQSIPVGLASPSEIVQVVSQRYDPPSSSRGEKGRLEFRLRAVGPIEGRPCLVELTLPADRIPGLISVGEGTFRSELAKPGDEVTLFAEGFQLDPRADEVGFVHLAIDGVERALVYRTRFARRGEPTRPIRDARPAVRLKVDPVALSSAALQVDFELDSPPEAGRLKLEFGQYSATGPGDRFRADAEATEDATPGRVRFNPRGPGGTLVFEATIRQPSARFDVGKVRGRRVVRALLEDESGRVRASDESPVILDDRPPSSVRFDPAPSYGLRGGTVTLRAKGQSPDSGIKEVVFFAGRPLDGKRPAGAAVVAAKPVAGDRESWTAALPLADARLGPLDVSVEFVPGVGPSRFESATISVVDAIPVAPGVIRGLVREGSRPQPGFEVRVYDEKGADKGTTKTDASGRFEVGNLAPGTYEVVSAKETPRTRGAAKVPVKAGTTVEVEVPMTRAP